ncbi:MAG: FtsX-like permease family protein, partial [Planctomycetota bacterium]|nr:FtsX-like permease family protein [Planctomycetota bacterium]
KTETWRETRATLLNAVKAEKIIVSIILGVVILFAGFMIFIILTVQVVEKGRDIGILQSIGATSTGVANLFFFAGTSICLSGLTLGTLFGISFGMGINTFQRWVHLLTGLEIFPQDVYYLDHIPVKFRLEDLAFIIITTVVVSLLASLIPARRAAKKLPTEGLRYS